MLGSVSVIVPTKNEAHNIAHFLASLPAEVEVVICDASTDATRSIVSRLRPSRTIIVRAPGTIAQARQLGVAASSGDILVFSDADVAFDETYFRRVLASTDWDGVCGAKRSRTDYVGDYELMTRAQVAVYEWFGIAAASGSNMAITRQAFDTLGGFRVELACNEDTELFLRAGRRGFRIRFDEHLVVWARDHRRLRAGRTAKLAHSLVRNVLLYLVCCQPRLPRLLEHDWG
jgi:glycosyltransferase involved in cell wall biosynthesis